MSRTIKVVNLVRGPSQVLQQFKMKTIFIVTLSALILCTYAVHGFILKDDDQVPVLVTTQVGNIIGIEEHALLNSTFGYKIQKFRGIPYAESPTGNLRFRKPVPKSNFTSTFDGTKEGPVCYQLENPFSSNYTRSEDCLRLNIYVPVTTSDKQLKPVMLWIHGGGFVSGDSNGFDASILSGHGDVIVVTINYRLAYYGFFTTGDSNSPGNYGLWDQHLAIKWTSNNIGSFGGDPNQMTVFGESAGASSVIYQTFYPGNKGLFQHAIAESGTITSQWAFGMTDFNVGFSKKFASTAGCKGQTVSEDINCLRMLPVGVLNSTMNTMTEGAAGPVLDHDFLLDMPDKLLKGDTNATSAMDMFHSVNLIIGFNSGDGMLDLFAWMFVTNTTNPFNFHMPRDVYERAILRHYVYDVYKVNVTEVARNLAVHEYTDWTDPADERKRVAKLIDIATDYYVGVSTVQTAMGHTINNSGGTSTYSYEFAVQPLSSRFPLPPIVNGPEVCKHADEIDYVFGMNIQRVSQNASLLYQYNTYMTAMTAWSNFAKTGNPNIPNDVTQYTITSWPEFASEMSYLRISPSMTQESAKTGMRAKAVDFWTNILPSVMNKSNI